MVYENVYKISNIQKNYCVLKNPTTVSRFKHKPKTRNMLNFKIPNLNGLYKMKKMDGLTGSGSCRWSRLCWGSRSWQCPREGLTVHHDLVLGSVCPNFETLSYLRHSRFMHFVDAVCMLHAIIMNCHQQLLQICQNLYFVYAEVRARCPKVGQVVRS